MKYLFMLVGDEKAWGSQTPEEMRRSYEAIDSWWREQVKAGRILSGYELKPTRTATTLRRNASGGISVTDGPFIESKEALGGYAVVDVPDLDAAIGLAKSMPLLEALEIRPIVESDEDRADMVA